jgi:cytosine/uracil/thiamine/allantoin permease
MKLQVLFWVVSLVVALVGSLGIEYIELWNKIAFVVVIVVVVFFFFYNIILVDITFNFKT